MSKSEEIQNLTTELSQLHAELNGPHPLTVICARMQHEFQGTLLDMHSKLSGMPMFSQNEDEVLRRLRTTIWAAKKCLSFRNELRSIMEGALSRMTSMCDQLRAEIQEHEV